MYNIKVFYLPTDAQENCFKKNIKIYIKTAPTCFGAVTIIREHIFELAIAAFVFNNFSVLIAGTQSCLLGLDNFHSRTIHLDII
jgi:hypothetical protein